MMKNKKGQIFEFLIVMAVFAILLSAYLLLGDKKDALSVNPEDKEFGAKQKRIFDIYQDAEEEHFKDYMKFRYVWQKPVLDLTANGGFMEGEQTRCGFLEGVYFWNINSFQWCLEEKNISENFKAKLINEIKKDESLKAKMIFQEKALLTTDFPEYSIFVKDNQLVINTDWVLYFGFGGSNYQPDYGFDVEMNYNFSEYNEILAKARQLIDHCYAKPSLDQCLDNDLKTQPYEKFQAPKCQERNCSFQVESLYSVWVYENNRLEKKPVRYRFALNFG